MDALWMILACAGKLTYRCENINHWQIIFLGEPWFLHIYVFLSGIYPFPHQNDEFQANSFSDKPT